ncbi:conserved hypothetical protein [Theileria orientalis strain Shintoku]|uniref:Uncharacterized protein n=1 Tax=Theileria orientalis strain Shintoku TaxID=869250 RepID=J7MES2_THEOR|nr:conserved hypothetical protein [Theileria orientalis strain Shintoku]BAM38694.1 conserved hypothetical protein [Theileria orientalis strain Shintoku]|eukprot:XP_009688995.1 conserved hypothetical protein [Theileria orientalis strain Shintoku]
MGPNLVLNRFISFTFGFLVVNAFANPDLERFYEIHPLFKQRDYAFLNFYELDSKNFKRFEKDVKGLTRYLQTKAGYDTSKVIGLKDLKPTDSLNKYQYIGIQTWYSPEHMKTAVDSLFSQKIISKGSLTDFGKKGTVLPRFETLKHSKSDDDDMEDDEEQTDEDDDEHIDEKSDTVDTAEKAESNYASEAAEADNRKKKGKENGNLSYLMDQMVKLSLELKQITNEINLMA